MNSKKHGGAGRGQGRKSAEESRIEKRKQYPLTILPSIMEPFRERYGRGWNQKVAEWIIKDLSTFNKTSTMDHVTLIAATEDRNGLIVRRPDINGNGAEIRKIAISGRDNGCVATINKSGFIGLNGISWRKHFASTDFDLQALVAEKIDEIKALFK